MNKFLPPKPEFQNEGLIDFIIRPAFEAWYDREIVPLFKDAVTVYGTSTRCLSDTKANNDIFTGTVIGITEIKIENAEDLLREVCKYHDDFEVMMNAVNKARKFLEKK